MSKDSPYLTYKGAVISNEVDSNGHMNVMYYVNKFELAGRNFSSEIGLTKEFIVRNNLGIVVVEHLIQYKKELFEDDLIFITTELKSFTKKVFHVVHSMYNVETNDLSATMSCKLVLLDFKTRKAVPIPEQICGHLNSIIQSKDIGD